MAPVFHHQGAAFFNAICCISILTNTGRIIAKDHIAKDYYLEGKNYGSIFVTSDSGFEAIVIGDVRPDTGNGFMYLYYQNTDQRNSYPNEKTIAALLRNVLDKERLEEGEGKAAYHDWPEYGGIEKQLTYFSEVVHRMASK